ncbi:MAG: response regulator transcription factor [Anaerolineae bacterium]|nr:response regulator transcription factor [Anaerolineae bacterium]
MITPIRVLLADDHAVVRAGIRQFLEQAADIAVIAEADDGEIARTLISQHKPDVAVLDIQMPKATGIEVTRWVRTHHPDVGVLVLTAYDDDPYVTAVLQAGANGYVLKTATPASIIQAVRDVHEGTSVLDPTITGRLLAHIAGRGTANLPLVEEVTEREREVLALAAKGYTNKAIGVQLGISDRTVQGHLAKIYQKLNTGSRTEAVMKAVSLGLIER